MSNNHQEQGAFNPVYNPLYLQIKGHILEYLKNGHWAPGEMIPSEQELADHFGVSQGTVRKAVHELSEENLLIRKQGKGTYVASHADSRAFFRFLRLVPTSGVKELTRSIPIECREGKATKESAMQLDLEEGDPVVIVNRILTFSEIPVVYDEICFPGDVFKGLTVDGLKDFDGSLYMYLEKQFNIRMIRAQEKVKAVLANDVSAQYLNIEIGEPLLSVERVSYAFFDKPMEWRRGLYLTNNHYYFNELG